METSASQTPRKTWPILPMALGYCALLAVMGLLLALDAHESLLSGLKAILTSQSVLLSDYAAIGGPGAALLSSALTVLLAVAVLHFSKAPINGSTLSTLGLVAGFSLFGKNVLNSPPILLGAWLSAKARRVPFSSCANVGVMATTLGPLVSFVCFSQSHHPIVGVLLGVLVGFAVPPLAQGTAKILRGMNLYNVGFACGLLAMVLMPVLHAAGIDPATVSLWSTEYSGFFGAFIVGLSLLFLVLGLLSARRSLPELGRRYLALLRTQGRAPCDYLHDFGGSAVLVNMGLNGLLGSGYLLLIGGVFNGPTVGAILTLMGFSAGGKHPRNCLPIMAGVALGGLTMRWDVTTPGAQIAAIFGTTLAPISGVFGIPAGILAGFLHGSVVLRTGGFVGGVNLYNNGFSGGLVALVLTGVLEELLPQRSRSAKPNDVPEK